MARRRSRAVVTYWASLLGGAVLLYHEFFLVPAKDYPPQRIALVVIAAGLFTNSLARPGSLLGPLVSWLTKRSIKIEVQNSSSSRSSRSSSSPPEH